MKLQPWINSLGFPSMHMWWERVKAHYRQAIFHQKGDAFNEYHIMQ